MKQSIKENPDQARDKARDLFDTPHWSQVVQIFRDHRPDTKCPSCGGPANIILDTVSLKWNSMACETCCKKQQDEQSRINYTQKRDSFLERINDYLTSFGVAKRFINASLSDFPEQYHAIAKSDKGLFLTGPRGTGKTHLAVAIMRYICMAIAHRSVSELQPISGMPLFVSAPDLLLEIRDCFQENATNSEREIIEKYSSIPVLVLDDLGAEKSTEWSLQTFYTVIDRRYREMRKTIITSNLSIAELSEKLGDRIASRIVEMCDIKIIQGDDRRLRK